MKQNLKEVAAFFDEIRSMQDALPEKDRYPMSDVPVVRRDAETDDWLMEERQWGWLYADWKPSAKYTTRKKYQRERFNARSETVDSTWGFRRAFPSKRCVLIGSGFYEPFIGGGEAYYTVDSGLIFFAGLWDHWTDGEETVESCTMLTTEANPLIAANRTGRMRQPVILTSLDQVDRYCSLEITERSQIEDLLAPLPESRMAIQPPESS